MPYLAGLNSALWTPMSPRTMSGSRRLDGLTSSAIVPAAMRPTSTPFSPTIMVLLLKRSAKTPAMIENSIKGKVKTTKVRVV